MVLFKIIWIFCHANIMESVLWFLDTSTHPLHVTMDRMSGDQQSPREEDLIQKASLLEKHQD